MDFNDLSIYGDNSFDMIMSVDAFYNHRDKQKLISELHRILVPEGILFFSDILINQTETSSVNLQIQ